MPDSDLIDITFLLDRSGSMQSVREETIAGFNQFLADQRQQEGQAKLSLIQFDHEYEPLCSGAELAEVPELTAATFVPRGMTALLDAMSRAIDETGQRLAALPEARRPGQVLLVILTDGLENASTQVTAEEVFTKVRHQQEAYQWQLVYLGANQDAIATAARYGIDASSAKTYASTPKGTAEIMKELSTATSRFRLSRKARSAGYFQKES